jgi:tRNA pseudouridine55 synthase
MARRKRGRDISGFVLVDKPSGPTSNQVLQRVRRLFDARKAGHTGTLDPLATGMLPICFGSATKAAALAIQADKTYEATGRLGIATDTGDSLGEPIETTDADQIESGAVSAVLEKFVGGIEQIPPRYSALNYQGKRMYEWARAGVEVPREPRKVQIHSIELIRENLPEFTIRVRCSKGTYIRTLIEDIGRALGSLAHVTALRRIAVDPFQEDAMVSLEALEAESDIEALLGSCLLPVDIVLQHLPAVEIPSAAAARLCQGQKVQLEQAPEPGRYRVYDADSAFIGIGELAPSGELFPKRIFI